ncbi:MAG: shikimate kinase [Deltaproteobacteria bacterium]|nr:shikimate kinase [Deltaproteobacteria bacterium]
MGTGKTTAGLLAANRLNIPFLDTDAAIEKKMGLTVAQIFSKKGETVFRILERQMILSTRHSSPQVVALGGGVVLSQGNRDVLWQGIWINLNTDIPAILKRVGDKKTRPMLRKKASRESVETLLKARLPYYRLAPYQVETGSLSPDAVADDILKIARKI